MKIRSQLQKIGFSEFQAQVFLTCLELGGGRVSDIARKAGVQRTTCYHYLLELLQRGLVSQSKKHGVQYFIAEDPRVLVHRTKEQLETIDSVLPELLGLYSVVPYKPKVSFYEGWEGARTVYEDTLTSLQSGDMIYSYTGFRKFSAFLPEPWKQDYIRRRTKKKIRVRIIAPESTYARQLERDALKELREIKIIPEKTLVFTADTQIYGNKVAIISLKENYMSVLIESKEIAEMQKMAFDLMWRGADTF